MRRSNKALSDGVDDETLQSNLPTKVQGRRTTADQAMDGLQVLASAKLVSARPQKYDRIAFPLPPARAARYQGIPRAEKLLLGLRPEHITEAKPHPEPGVEPFDAVLDVTEPMGMETLIYFTLEGSQVCGRVNPNAGAQDGAPLRLAVDLNNMHLLNEVTGVVL